LKNELRPKRLVVGRTESPGQIAPATIYLGLFNAEPYLESLLEQLQAQQQDLPILVVDNASEDGTWSRIQNWANVFGHRITLVKNPQNLGGAGSLYLNSDLITTDWFLTFHQDDYYLENHASVLCAAIGSSPSDTICISTEMGRLSPRGFKSPTPPRASWFLPDTTPETIFLTNLRLHNVPFPAAAFRTKMFFKIETPWHSTSFPDTEWVLLAASLGTFKFLAEETMRYRENASSESHAIDTAEKYLGSTSALMRVFANPSFRQICYGVRPEDRNDFAKACFDGIEIRLGEVKDYSNLIKLAAAEQMTSAWGYGETIPSSFVSDFYRSLGSPRVPRFLNSFRLQGADARDKSDVPKTNIGPMINIHFKETSAVSTLGLRSAFMKLAALMYATLPRKIRKSLLQFLSRLFSKWLRKSPWGLTWR
jgi:glycosyltransferase involved in cell wall biosynthesis